MVGAAVTVVVTPILNTVIIIIIMNVIIIVTPVDRILQFCNNIPGCLLLSCNTWVTKGTIDLNKIKPGVIRRLPSPVKSYSATKAGAKVSAFAKNQDNIYSPMTLPLGFPP